MADDLWIVIPNWDRFQHYKGRDPGWIKDYTSLLHKDEYLRLTGHQRGVLHGLWLAYASAHCQLRLDTASLTRQLALRVSSATLEALGNAGWIEVSSRPSLAQTRQDMFLTEHREEKDKTVSADESPVENLSEPIVDRLASEIRDADDTTLSILQSLQSQLPESAFAQALESLRTRRNRKPALKSEARYVVGTLKTMQRERTSR